MTTQTHKTARVDRFYGGYQPVRIPLQRKLLVRPLARAACSVCLLFDDSDAGAYK